MSQNKNIKKVAIVMGSQSDYPIMKNCVEILKKLNIKYETQIVSAHRTPERMFDFAKKAIKNNFAVIVAGAGGSAQCAEPPAPATITAKLFFIAFFAKSNILSGV